MARRKIDKLGMSSHQRGHRGASDVWLTPPNIINALGHFDLDPCAAPEPRPWPTAARHIVLPEDGLAAEWEGFVWCNPPFGPEAESWLQKMGKHNNGIALVPARTETRWFVETAWKAAEAILFLHSRPHFHYPDGTRGKANSGAPICLIAYGSSAAHRLVSTTLPGTLVAGWVSTPLER